MGAAWALLAFACAACGSEAPMNGVRVAAQLAPATEPKPLAPASPPKAAPALQATAPAAPVSPTTPPAVTPKAAPTLHAGWTLVHGTVTRTLYDGFAEQFPDDDAGHLLADQLAAHFKRLFFFVVDFTRDVHPKDRFAFIYEHTPESTDGLRIVAATFDSDITNSHYASYFFKHEDPRYGNRHYDAKGQESQARMQNSPVDHYEQITSLLNDRRPRHEGIDFKGPVGTPITVPFDATVLDVNRRGARGNGRFIKLRYDKNGYEALFLHMDSVDPEVVEGRRLKAGTSLGTMGNTGHSFAPHLHYQIQLGKRRPLDPFKIHGSSYRKLPSTLMPAFQSQLTTLEKLLTH